MARTGRPTNNPTTLARKALIADIASKAVTYSAMTLARRMRGLLESNSEAFASATGSAMLGNGRRGLIRRAMTAAQNGACFTCGAKLDSHPYTMSTLFRLIPSIVGADEEIAGVDAMQAGTLPGNVVVVCVTCNADRNRKSAAQGYPAAVTSSVMVTDGPVLNVNTILYVWPKGAGPRGIVPEYVEVAAPIDASNFERRRTARMALLGW